MESFKKKSFEAPKAVKAEKVTKRAPLKVTGKDKNGNPVHSGGKKMTVESCR